MNRLAAATSNALFMTFLLGVKDGASSMESDLPFHEQPFSYPHRRAAKSAAANMRRGGVTANAGPDGVGKAEEEKLMATVKLSDIQSMTDDENSSKAERLALEFLELFEADRPLDQEEFEEWVQINSLSAAEVKVAAEEAVRKGWVEDTPDGLLLTEAGEQKREE
jgi:hypothetical protein